MRIGKVREVREFDPKIIPVEIPKTAPVKREDDPIPAPNWPAPVKEPAKVK